MLTTEQFTTLMQTLADSWNAGNPEQAISCFTEDAEYLEPPNKQYFRGQKELFIYFGGNSPKPMSMVWHHLWFDEANQTGSGEYTFEVQEQNHGVAVVELKEGKISKWREYQWSGNLPFAEFLNPHKNFLSTIKNYSSERS
jgi:hypothetical protein